jgi:DnaJ family protein C protein 2
MAKDLVLPIADSNTNSASVSPIAALVETNVEPYGRGFEQYLRVIHSLESIELPDPDEVIDNLNASVGGPISESQAKAFESHKKKPANSLDHLIEKDYYDVLGLSELRYNATQDDIKKAYRKVCLIHHPDKQAQSSGGADFDDTLFKNIQKAYETLSVPKLKRGYDSRDPFDDSLPDIYDIKSDADFYAYFGECFTRNAKWSNSGGSPALGDATTPYEKVEKFYAFWYSFKSWRDFSQFDEYDLEEAENRDERRWMEKQNQTKRQGKDKAEKARISKLVDMAYKLDPRVKKQVEAEKKEKEEKRLARLAAKNSVKDEKERLEREAKEKEEAEVKRVAEDKKANTKIMANCRSKLRQFTRAHGLKETDTDYLITNLSQSDLKNLHLAMTQIENPTPEIAEAFFKNAIVDFKNNVSPVVRAVDASSASTTPLDTPIATPVTSPQATPTKEEAKVSAVADNEEWSANEIHLLSKAVLKFPIGTRDRYERIQEFIGGGKTVKQVIARTKSAVKVDASPLTQEDQFLRWQREKKEAKKPTDVSGGSIDYDHILATEEREEKAEANATETPTEEAKGEAAANPEDAKILEWTPDEQKLLEDALKNFPATLGKDRWTRIAQTIPGRNKKECFDRYKYLVSVCKK